MQNITPFLWFDNQALEAAKFYTSIFPNSKILTQMDTPEGTPEPTSDVLTVSFELNGVTFTALNGGPAFKFNMAVSFVVRCKDQKEVDYYWDKLVEGGEPSQCGWLTDKYGLSWQITPDELIEYMCDPDSEKSARTMKAMLTMGKIDMAEIKRAHDGG